MFDLVQNSASRGRHHHRIDRVGETADPQREAFARALAAVEAAIARLEPVKAARGRGRPRADRSAIVRSLIAKTTFGIPTVGALIERLKVDRELRAQCGWQEGSEIPTGATFSRARFELSAKLPASVHRYIGESPRHALESDCSTETMVASDEPCASDPLLGALREHLLAMVHADERHLTLPQLAILLTCYLLDRPHTVRSLSDELDALPYEVTRAVALLRKAKLVARKIDPTNRRRILVLRTETGRRYLEEMLQLQVRRESPREHMTGKALSRAQL